ncbi:Alpha/Beta hydrolase protein [Cladochytrium replicatum]|nr:Alpha/Beta hydrolase protein [Cladochytrium replicatum]
MSLVPSAGARDFSVVLSEQTRISGKLWGREPENATDPTRRFLCMHGWLDNANTWDNVIPQLMKTYGDNVSFISLDFAGHGWSDHRGEFEEYTQHRFVFDVLQVADLIGWVQFGILAHSMGGGTGLIIAGTFSQRVSCLITVDVLGPVSVDADRQPELLYKSWIDRQEFPKRNPKPLYSSVMEAAKARARSGEVTLEAALILAERGLMVVQVPGGEEKYTWRTDQRLRAVAPAMFTNDTVLEMIRRVEVPVLAVLAPTPTGSGEQVDGRIEALGKKGTIVRVEAGHHLHLDPDSADEFVKVVKTFLEERVWKEERQLMARL